MRADLRPSGSTLHTDHMGNNHRPLWRLMHKNTAVLYPDQIRVPSWRQENGDKRADPRGRVPGDVFDFTRVTWELKLLPCLAPDAIERGPRGALRAVLDARRTDRA